MLSNDLGHKGQQIYVNRHNFCCFRHYFYLELVLFHVLQIKYAENSHKSHQKYLVELNEKEKKRKILIGQKFCPSEIIYIQNEK